MRTKWPQVFKLAQCRPYHGVGKRRFMDISNTAPAKAAQDRSSLGQKTRKVPILDAVFRDRNLYGTGFTELTSFRDYATPNSTLASSPSEIRGLPQVTLSYMFSQRLLTGNPDHLLTRDFKIYYFPPWHPLAMGRTSRPAVAIVYGPNEAYNGAIASTGQLASPSKRPFSYAFWRLRTKHLLKKAFFKAWVRMGTIDGAYVIVAHRVPTNLAELETHCGRFLEKISRQSNREWVNNHSAKLRPKVMHQALKAEYGIPPRIFSKADWLA